MAQRQWRDGIKHLEALCPYYDYFRDQTLWWEGHGGLPRWEQYDLAAQAAAQPSSLPDYPGHDDLGELERSRCARPLQEQREKLMDHEHRVQALNVEIQNLIMMETNLSERELLAHEQLVKKWQSDLGKRKRQVNNLEDRVHAFETTQHAAPELSSAIGNELADKTRDAIKALDDAEEALKTAEVAVGSDDLEQSRKLLEAPETAPRALLLVNAIADRCMNEAPEALEDMKKTQAAVRNVAALHIMSVSRPGNRDSFLMEAEKAFKTDLNSEAVLRSQILHGCSKLWENYTCPNCQCQ